MATRIDGPSDDEMMAFRVERAEQARRAACYPALLAAAERALQHIEELEEAWRRGVLRDGEGESGIRSNRNVDCRVLLRAAIAKASPQAR